MWLSKCGHALLSDLFSSIFALSNPGNSSLDLFEHRLHPLSPAFWHVEGLVRNQIDLARWILKKVGPVEIAFVDFFGLLFVEPSSLLAVLEQRVLRFPSFLAPVKTMLLSVPPER
jgi:hypothetical protein